MKKALKKIVIVLCAVLCLSTTAFAAEMDPNVARAYELDIIYDSLANKPKEEITRKEFAETLINFYRKTTGRSGITLNIGKFFDTRSVEVVVACELGLMQEVKENEFNPNGYVTRSEAALALHKLFKLCSQPIREYNGYSSYFTDISKYDNETKLAINTLRANEIMVGSDNKFHGESHILVYEVAAAMVRTYDIAVEVGFEIDGKEIFYNQTVEALVDDFGQPERIDVNQHGNKRYVYNSSDASKFFIVGVDGGKVKEIFSNSTGFKFGDIVSGMEYSKIDFTDFNTVTTSAAVINGEFYNLKFIFAVNENGITVDSIHLYERHKVTYNNNYNSTLASSIEKELWDMLSIRSIKSGLVPFHKDSDLYASLKRHCADVSKSFENGNGTGLSSIDRVEKDRIKYTSILENKLSIRGDSVNVYEMIMKEVGSRAILSSTTLKNAAIAVSPINNNMYIVIDIYK